MFLSLTPNLYIETSSSAQCHTNEWLGGGDSHKGEILMEKLMSLGDPREILTGLRPEKNTTIYCPGTGTPSDTESAKALVWDFPDSKTIHFYCLLVIWLVAFLLFTGHFVDSILFHLNG